LDETAAGTDDTVLGYELNDAVRQFLLDTHCNVNRSETTIAAATDDSEIASSVLAIDNIQVTSGSIVSVPVRVTPDEILEMRRASAATGSSGNGRYYALQGSDLLMWYPALAIGDVVLTYYVPKPTEMSSGSHDPATETYGGIPVEYHPALIAYAKWKMADYDDDGSSQMGLVYKAEYDNLVKEVRKDMRGKGGRSLRRAQVGRRPVFPRVPSQDVW
jgi:hypothetical protein